ncbi:MAG: DNA-processing protein DprA [Candidatus Paceibacterota bacterium]|jgi:DNA processing protein
MEDEIRKLDKKDFPESFLEIPEPPKELFIKGILPSEDFIFLSVVGSRKYTSYGKDVCEKLISGLRGYPIVIVSGLALGIDTVAHKKALEIGLKTIAFPGSGLDKKVLYPATNWRLALEIVESGGCLISEFKPDFRATVWSFPQRNRLMAGISKAVLIIEAEEKSGTLITARLALDYNKDVFAVPGSIFSPNSKGTNKLLRQGATPITTSEELLDALGFQVNNTENIQKEIEENCTDEEKEILKLIQDSISKDDLFRKLNKPTNETNAILSVMEIKGLIKEELGEIRRC